jgi:hypothetical protein
MVGKSPYSGLLDTFELCRNIYRRCRFQFRCEILKISMSLVCYCSFCHVSVRFKKRVKLSVDICGAIVWETMQITPRK